MNRDQIETVRAEAQRLLDKIDAASNAFEWCKYNNGNGGFWRNTDTVATGALRRSSMDLTRALAAMRARGQ